MNNEDWLRQLNLTNFDLCPPLKMPSLTMAESQLSCHIPTEYIEFLSFSDGAAVRFEGGEFVFFPLFQAHPKLGTATVVHLYEIVKEEAPTRPLLEIGYGVFGVEEAIGFAKSDLSSPSERCSVHVYWHETGEYDQLAPSFRHFMSELAAIPAGGNYVPPWLRGDLSVAPTQGAKKWWQCWRSE